MDLQNLNSEIVHWHRPKRQKVLCVWNGLGYMDSRSKQNAVSSRFSPVAETAYVDE